MKLYQAIANQITLYHGAMADDSLDWADFHKRFALALAAFGLPVLGEDESAGKLVLSLSHQDCLIFRSEHLALS